MPENSAADYWPALDKTGKTDADVVNVHDAIFLFAVRELRAARPGALEEVWKQHAPFWRRRLCKNGFTYLQVVCKVQYESFQAPAQRRVNE